LVARGDSGPLSKPRFLRISSLILKESFVCAGLGEIFFPESLKVDALAPPPCYSLSSTA
jgi:hypothetical protein